MIWIALTLLLIGAVIVFVAARKKAIDPLVAWPYRSKPLLSGAEQALYTRLSEALPDHVVLAQVSLAQAVSITARARERTPWWNKIAQKSLDFVICNPDFSIAAVVELDDRSHEGERQQRRDQDKTQVLASAQLRLIRWKAGELPSGSQIRSAVLGAPELGGPPPAKESA